MLPHYRQTEAYSFIIIVALSTLCAITDRSNLTAMVVTSPSITGRSGWLLLCRASLLVCSRSCVSWYKSCRSYASLQHNTTFTPRHITSHITDTRHQTPAVGCGLIKKVPYLISALV